MPGAGPLTGALLLAEISDDPNRFSDARALKAYAGAAPITKESGKSHHVGYRRAKNDRIAAAGYVGLTRSDGHLKTGDTCPDGVRLNGEALEAQVHH